MEMVDATNLDRKSRVHGLKTTGEALQRLHLPHHSSHCGGAPLPEAGSTAVAAGAFSVDNNFGTFCLAAAPCAVSAVASAAAGNLGTFGLAAGAWAVSVVASPAGGNFGTFGLATGGCVVAEPSSATAAAAAPGTGAYF